MRRSLAVRGNPVDPMETAFVFGKPRHHLKPLRVPATGVRVLHDPVWNKGTGFDYVERDTLGLRGLLPPVFRTLEQQVRRCLAHLDQLESPIDKNLYLQDLQNRNETLYFRVLVENLAKMAPIVYTPTVGHVCQKFGSQFARARGMYFSKYDRGHFSTIMHNWPHSDVHCVVVTDGSRVLGLGDLGVQGMGISIGKLALYTAAGGIAPHRVLPVVLDVGCNNPKIRDDPEYLGIREPRLEGEEYFDMVDEFMHAISARWPNSLVQFEDFESKKAQPMLERYRSSFRMFNDDIQGTGCVTLAGILSAVKISGQRIQDVRVLCVGAGSAGIGVCNQLLEGMVAAGVPRSTARKSFALMTNLGVIGVPDDRFGNPNHVPENFNESHLPWVNPTLSDGMSLIDAIETFQPNVLLGLSTAGGLFDEKIIRAMASINERPIIMPMSNPTSSAECTPADAYKWSDGRAIVATGSPFDPVQIDGKTFIPSQANNVYCFPGIGLASSVSGVKKITDKMLYEAALAIANSLSPQEEAEGRTFPDIARIRDVSLAVAKATIIEGRKRNLLLSSKHAIDVADEDLDDLIRRKMYWPYYTPLYHAQRD